MGAKDFPTSIFLPTSEHFSRREVERDGEVVSVGCGGLDVASVSGGRSNCFGSAILHRP